MMVVDPAPGAAASRQYAYTDSDPRAERTKRRSR